eukprot:1152208-Pelagomonas_calceolata.AAC.2
MPSRYSLTPFKSFPILVEAACSSEQQRQQHGVRACSSLHCQWYEQARNAGGVGRAWCAWVQCRCFKGCSTGSCLCSAA